MRFTLPIATASVLAAASVVHADIYLHAPRGSNNRNCRTDNNENRQNGNRMFDSQNNAKGGYSCPRAWPFACYKLDNGEDKNDCNDMNNDLAKAAGKLVVGPDGVEGGVNTPMSRFFSKSILTVEWTNQHGMGTNGKLHSDVVIQYSCQEQLQDNCGEGVLGKDPGEALGPEAGLGDLKQSDKTCRIGKGLVEGVKKCLPRDGFPISNTADNDRDLQATDTISDTDAADQDDYRYGRHEGAEYYQQCKQRLRNKGLYTADQNLKGNSAIYTRVNPDGTRRGLECPEEAHYYPYWHPSPWIDVAMITSDMSDCKKRVAQSQNVVRKGYCDCGLGCNIEGNNLVPNTEGGCTGVGGVWCMSPSFRELGKADGAPQCLQGAFNRENHLGNTGNLGGNANEFNFTLPVVSAPTQCVMRVRYNISHGDFNSISRRGNRTHNGEFSLLKDQDNNNKGSYKALLNIGTLNDGAKLGYAVNTNQAGRTFQDRTYMFELAPLPKDMPPCKKVYNLITRGKRGNIVQSYPSVEYDFSPNPLVTEEGDCVHVNFMGSDYNPNRQGNNGEGGPFQPNQENGKADRHNIVELDEENINSYAKTDVDEWNMFKASKEVKLNLAYSGQAYADPEECWDYDRIKDKVGNNQQRIESYYKNCGKMSGVATPIFDGGIVQVGNKGTYRYMSTRNNNFSNRDQKSTLVVRSAGMTTVEIVFTVLGTLAGGAVIAGAVLLYRKGDLHLPSRLPGLPTGMAAVPVLKAGKNKNSSPAVPSRPGSNMGKVTALYAHDVSEEGELSFGIGETILVTKKDGSGWWEGTNAAGERGVFPSNYVR